MSTEKLARFIADTTYEQLPDKARNEVRRSMLDLIGVTLAGREEIGSKILARYVQDMAAKPESGVIGCGFKTTAAEAAWVNGAMGHALDYDDSARFVAGHPTVALLPAVLAVAEKAHASGKDAFLAYIVGFEVMARVGPSMPQHYAQGWHATCTLGTLGAAAASAKLLKLNAHECKMAIGLAASLSAGLRQNFGTMTKPFHAGNAAKNGVIAATLAQNGFTADETVLENPQQGFLKIFNASVAGDISKLADGLGERWDVAGALMIKPYPSCLGTHAGIDAVLYLRNTHSINVKDIEDIECRVAETVPRIVIHSRPKTGLEGKFSNQYTIARALLDGGVGMVHFSDRMVMQPEAQELLKKVRYVHPPSMANAGLGAEVSIKTKNGKTYTHQVLRSKGTEVNPLTWDELCYKYRDCASLILPKPSVERCLKMITELEKLKDISKLMDILTFTAKKRIKRIPS